MTSICLSLLGGSSLADARANDLRSATRYPCSSLGLTPSNGRWISHWHCRLKRVGNEIAAGGLPAKTKVGADSGACAISGLEQGTAFRITFPLLRKIPCFFCAFSGRMPTESFLGGRLRRRGATAHERFTRYPER